MSPSLREFIATLRAAGELHEINASVSPLLEVAEVADRHAKAPAASVSAHARVFDRRHCELGGKALLFHDVEGCDFPLAINVFGSYRRMEMALGCHGAGGGFEAIARRIGSIAQPQPPRSLRELAAKGREFLPLLKTPPKRVRTGPCQEVVLRTDHDEVDLTRLPLIKCWPLDGDPSAVGYPLTPEQAGTGAGDGRYITFAGMHTIHADDRGASRASSHNIGMYRAQLIDATRLAMHWHVHHDGAAHWRSWKHLGAPMPIAICLGGESVLPYAATAPLPPGLSELLIAGFLNGSGIPMVPAKTVPLRVPANCEIVIEGYVSTECGPIGYDPRVSNEPLGPGAVFEGPFGDHTGFYSLPDRYPIVNVTAVTHRRDAIFPATIVGPPPQEDYYLGKATERLFLPLLKTIIHDIDDYHLPMFGCFHNCAFVRIHKAYPLQARRVMHAIWGAGQMAWTKMIVVVDDDVDVHDEFAVWRAVSERSHFQRDIEVVNGPLDILDHAAPRLGAGHKIGFDATRAWPGEEVGGVPHDAPVATLDVDGVDALHRLLGSLIGHGGITAVELPEFGAGRVVFVSVEKTTAQRGAEAITTVWNTADRGAELVIAVDAAVDVRDPEAVFFHLCANCDPGRDARRRGSRFALDATTKHPDDARHGQPVRDWPPLLGMSEAIHRRVDERAHEFGL